MLKLTVWSLVLFAIFADTAAAESTEDPSANTLKLDGLLYEGQRPETSLAIINGRDLRVGDDFDDLIVERIERNAVTLRSPDGREEIVLRPWSAAYTRTPAPPPTPTPTTAVPPAPPNADAPSGKTPWGFQALLNQSVEVRAMASLRNLFTAAMVAANEESYDESGKPSVPTLTIGKLKERGYLPEDFLAEDGKYRYTMQQGGGFGQFDAHANPVDPNSDLRHFMIDQDGALHAERGRPATKSSPAP